MKGNLYIRGKVYWLKARVDGKQIRISTRSRCQEDAEAFRDRFLMASRVRALDSGEKIDMASLKRMLMSSKSRAKRDGIENSLTMEQLVILEAQSGGRCAVSGLPFSDRKAPGMRMAPFAASLDRKNCGEGYSLANCRLVCCAVNMAMNTWGEGPLEIIAKAVVRARLGQEIASAQIAHTKWTPRVVSRKKAA